MNEDRIKELEAEVERLSRELDRARERERDLEDSRRAMLYMLEDLEESQRLIKQGKREWEATFDSISDPLFIHDRELRIVRANRAYQAISGLPFDEIIGRPYIEVFPRMDRPFRICRKALELGREEEMEENEEEILIPQINRVFKVRFYPLRDTAGGYMYSVHILEDITEQRQAEERMRQEMEITSNLLMIARATARTTDIERLMEEVIRCTHRIMGCSVCMSYLWDGDARLFRPSQSCGLSHELVPMFRTETLDEGVPFVRKVLQMKRPMVIFKEGAPVLEGQPYRWIEGLQSAIFIPLILKEDNLGLLVGVYTSRKELTERDMEILEGISYQVSVALEEARLYREAINRAMELSHRIETIQVMHEIDRSILSTLEPEEILETAIRMVTKIVSCDRATIALVDRERGGLTYAAGFGITSLSKGAFVPFSDTSAATVVMTKRPEFVANLKECEGILPLEKNLLEEGFLSHIRVPVVVKGEVVGVMSIGAKRPSAFTPDNLSTIEKVAAQIAVALANARLLQDLEELFLGTVKALSDAIDAKSPWTRGHSERVTEYALAIAEEMGMDGRELEDLRIAGLLHDIGKIGTYDVILDKPGKLDEKEYEMVKKHPLRGAEMLQPIRQLRHIIPWIRHHHEWYDGTGYPDGLKGEETPLMARILAVADTFDSMTAERPYRKTPGMEKALEEFRKYSGTQFDPEVVSVFLRCVEKGRIRPNRHAPGPSSSSSSR